MARANCGFTYERIYVYVYMLCDNDDGYIFNILKKPEA